MVEGEKETMMFNVFDKFWLALLLLFSVYFLRAEWRQVKLKKWEYLFDVWNYADITPPLIIIIIVFADIFTKEEGPMQSRIRYSMQAIANFFMWVKIFYFLRIFRQTGFFVNMLLKVI